MCANGNPLRLNVLRQFPRKKKKKQKKSRSMGQLYCNIYAGLHVMAKPCSLPLPSVEIQNQHSHPRDVINEQIHELHFQKIQYLLCIKLIEKI